MTEFYEKALQFDTDNITPSLCDGMAKRIFKNISAHTNNALISLPGSHANLFPYLNNYPSTLRGRMGRSEALKTLCAHFAALTTIDKFRSFHIKKNKSKNFDFNNLCMMRGLIIEQDSLTMVYLNLDQKKPHRSEYIIDPIMFSVHAISRVMYRLKPASLFQAIIDISRVCTEFLEAHHDKDIELLNDGNGNLWIPVVDVGCFLMCPIEIGEESPSYRMVTFVDSKQMFDLQVYQGNELIRQFEETDASKLLSILKSSKHITESRRSKNLNFDTVMMDGSPAALQKARMAANTSRNL